jgi:hypothetical protein
MNLVSLEPRVQTRTIPIPIRLNGQFACPRCRGRLFFDGDELVCVLCGYEHDVPLPAAA